MHDAAVISGSLVDVRNVGTHKSIKLTVHVPEEHAMKVMEAFGWPTGVAPVSVAIARLAPVANQKEASAAPRPVSPPPGGAARERKEWNELAPAQQAGILCGEPAFWKYLEERGTYAPETAEEAAQAVREICQVSSRKDIQPGSQSHRILAALAADYRSWMREPEMVG